MSWSDVVPNFDSLPPAMQDWVKANMQSLVDAAMQAAQQMNASNTDAAHNFGISAGGTSYSLTGANHFFAVQGGSQEVVGQLKQQVLQGGQMTLNNQDDHTQIDGLATKSIGGNSYLQVKGTSYAKMSSEHNSVEEDEVTLIGGTSTKIVSNWESIQIGSGTAGGNEIVSQEEIYGSENKLVWGNGWERITGYRYEAVGPGVSLPVPESSLKAGETQPPVAATTTSTTNKNIQNGIKLGWTTVSGASPAGLATDITTTILGAKPKTVDPVSMELIGGDKQESVYGGETVLITGMSKETVLGGTNNFISGNMSELKMGMTSDTLLGLSMDTVIGMSMPFETLTMGQVLVSLDAVVFSGESSSFELSMSSMKILTSGAAAAASDAEAAAEAADAVKDAESFEKAAKAAEGATDTSKQLEEATKASEQASKAATELEDASKAADKAAEASKAASTAAKDSKTATSAEKAAAAASEAADVDKAAKAGEAAKSAKKAAGLADDAKTTAKEADEAAKASKAADEAAETSAKVADEAEKAAKTQEEVLDAAMLSELATADKATAAAAKVKAAETAAKATEAAKASAKAAEESATAAEDAAKAAEKSAEASKEVETAQREAAEADKFASELKKTISIPDSFPGGEKAFTALTKGPLNSLLESAGLSKNAVTGLKAAGKVAFKTASVGTGASAAFDSAKPPGTGNDGSEAADKDAANKLLGGGGEA